VAAEPKSIPAPKSDRNSAHPLPFLLVPRPHGFYSGRGSTIHRRGLVRMSLIVNCPCGQPIQTQPEHRGKRIRCPKCREILRVPPPDPPQVKDEEFLEPILEEDEADAQPVLAEVVATGTYGFANSLQCPKCKREWPTETVLCVNCGYNFKTGKQLKTEYDLRDRTLTVQGLIPGNSMRLTVRRDEKKRRYLVKENWTLGIASGKEMFDLEKFDSVTTDYTTDVFIHAPGRENFVDELYLLYLEGDRRVKLWLGSSERTMHEIVDFLKGAGLTIKRK
jgi:hypothetical protein